MASICSLPTEILLQVFTDEAITNADLARCASTCKLFNLITSQCKINYIFKVDNPSHSAWKLIQHLLLYPKTGERFQSITVTWHRRVPRHPKTWALKWNWKKGEEEELDRLCKEWDIWDMSEDICAGWNSEALIPLLLCFTTKLESLDYGGTVLPIMHPSPAVHEGIRIHEYCEGQGYRWQPKDDHDNGFDWFDECWGTKDKGVSRFYSVLDRKTPLPGLSHLRKFTHGGCINDNHWPGEYLSQIMLLPRLEEVVVVSKPAKIGQFRPNTPKLKFPTGKTSSIRKLELIDCSFFDGEVEALAKFTGSLTSLNHALCWFRTEEIVDWFQRANNSLTQDRITGIFTPRPEYEEDLGPVDKDKYYKFRYDYSDTDAYNESVGSSSSEEEW